MRARLRLRSPLPDPVKERRAVDELRDALRNTYIVMAERIGSRQDCTVSPATTEPIH
ncbi:hypothetical protein Sgleb_75830 [Streptomyces glebosus]|uniref:Uncharacterized protein n=1 Tax=Streptomyces glebosus TaxID=249580 RepID=A0A640TB69_9ACTN|nr:hypothetical protein Sgleb_75830 [Streptomyces glebosus]GHG63445.1 hypothetical protein GCM10010513_31020 [Streptomyces glebosus]